MDRALFPIPSSGNTRIIPVGANSLDLRDHPAGRLPTSSLVEESFVLDQWLLARPSHRTRQKFGNVPLQAVVRRDADGVLHAPLLQRLVRIPGQANHDSGVIPITVPK
jgi:hypothetical protein